MQIAVPQSLKYHLQFFFPLGNVKIVVICFILPEIQKKWQCFAKDHFVNHNHSDNHNHQAFFNWHLLFPLTFFLPFSSSPFAHEKARI